MANGQLESITSSNPNGVNVGYRYDALNRLEYVDDASTGLPVRTTSYTYNSNGSLETVTYANNVVHTYGYDTLNRLLTLGVARVGDPGNPLHSYEYKLRPSGHRQRIIENRTHTTTFDYDSLYRLSAETITGDTHGNNGSVTYTLDKVGNRGARVSSVPPVLLSLKIVFFRHDSPRGCHEL